MSSQVGRRSPRQPQAAGGFGAGRQPAGRADATGAVRSAPGAPRRHARAHAHAHTCTHSSWARAHAHTRVYTPQGSEGQDGQDSRPSLTPDGRTNGPDAPAAEWLQHTGGWGVRYRAGATHGVLRRRELSLRVAHFAGHPLGPSQSRWARCSQTADRRGRRGERRDWPKVACLGRSLQPGLCCEPVVCKQRELGPQHV